MLPGTGKFGHALIPKDETTQIAVTNKFTKTDTKEATTWVWHVEPFEIHLNIIAHEVSGTGWIRNNSTTHEIEGTVTLKLGQVTVEDEIGPCEVPGGAIEFSADFHSVDKANGEMGLEYSPDPTESEAFVEFGVACELLGGEEMPLTVSGSFVGVGANPSANSSGATQVFKGENTELEVGGSECVLTATLTTSMSGGGNPISPTTG